MNYIHDTTAFSVDGPSAITLGKFDGLHRGHQKLIHRILEKKEEGCSAVVFTIAPQNIPMLLTPEEKRNMLEQYEIDYMIQCPFVKEILSMEPEVFVRDILIKQLHAKYIVVGTDFRFGHNRSGDVNLLKDLQAKYDFVLSVEEKECCRGREISSTYIKEALAQSDLALVNELLGYDYPVYGKILHGKQIGRAMGMPTINQIPDTRKLLPAFGVYYSHVTIEGKEYMGMTNIGCKPTVDGTFTGIETYLYNINEDLYEKEAMVYLGKFRRAEMKFDSLQALQNQMERDIEAGKEYFRKK